MAVDLTLRLTDEPGSLATAAEALGAAGINIDGGCGVTTQGEGEVHLLVEDAVAAAAALGDAGVAIEAQRPVLLVEADDRPGELGSIARQLADAGVNINLLYLATRTRLVIGADDLAAAEAALGG